MSDSLIILEKLVLLFCFIFVGFFCFRKGWLTKQGTSEISNLIVNVFNPLLMISTALSGSGSIPKNLMAQNLILMALFYGLMILLGPVVAKLLRVQGNDRKLVTIMLVFANTAFMGIPLRLGGNVLHHVLCAGVQPSLLYLCHSGVQENVRGQIPIPVQGSR